MASSSSGRVNETMKLMIMLLWQRYSLIWAIPNEGFFWLASLTWHTSDSGSGVSLAIFRALSRKKHDEAHNNQHLLKYSNLFLKTQQPSYLSGVVHSACFSESWIQLLIKNFDSMLMLNINLIYRCQFI